jgi:hypothetical protein
LNPDDTWAGILCSGHDCYVVYLSRLLVLFHPYFLNAMVEEMGKVVFVGKRGSGRSNVANMLVDGQGCPLVPTGNTSICETYEGRGWTMVDTLGFDEPLGNTVPDEYARTMAVDFLNEVKGRYTHIAGPRGCFPYVSINN